MNRIIDWWRRSAEALGELVERPWLCAAVLLALRSLVRPYWGLVHDAKLYSVQVARHVWPNVYDSDLFFAYGSQDRFSIFSRLMAPLSAAIGIEPSFFVVWTFCAAAIVFAEVLLVRRLIGNRSLAAIALILLAISDVAYGGMHVFRVHEPFLTARLPAVALVLFAFVQLLDKRHVLGVLLLAAAMVLHPLMSLPAFLAGGAYIASARWKTQRLAIIGIVAVIAGAMIGLIPSVGEAAFGRMDGEWLRITKEICAHCFLPRWSVSEWGRTCLALAIVFAARFHLPPAAARLAFWVGFTAIGGLAVAAYAEWTQYAFLIQGQASRAVWLAELLAHPLGLLLAARLWQARSDVLPARWLRAKNVGRRLAAIPFAAFAMQPFVSGSMEGESALQSIGLWIACSLCVAACLHAWAERIGRTARLGMAVFGGMLGMSVCLSFAQFGSYVALADDLSEGASTLWWVGAHMVSVAVIATAASAGLAILVCRLDVGWRTATLAMSTWLAVGAAPFVFDSLRIGPKQMMDDEADVAFVKAFLAANGTGSVPHVYWPLDPTRTWLEVHGTSYFSWHQMCGIIFCEDLAEVVAARGHLTRPLEVDCMREMGLPESKWDVPLRMLQTDFSEPLPQKEDLVRLAQDPALDWIVLKCNFEGLSAADNGSIFIYDAHKLRESAEFASRIE